MNVGPLKLITLVVLYSEGPVNSVLDFRRQRCYNTFKSIPCCSLWQLHYTYTYTNKSFRKITLIKLIHISDLLVDIFLRKISITDFEIVLPVQLSVW